MAGRDDIGPRTVEREHVRFGPELIRPPGIKTTLNYHAVVEETLVHRSCGYTTEDKRIVLCASYWIHDSKLRFAVDEIVTCIRCLGYGDDLP